MLLRPTKRHFSRLITINRFRDSEIFPETTGLLPQINVAGYQFTFFPSSLIFVGTGPRDSTSHSVILYSTEFAVQFSIVGRQTRLFFANKWRDDIAV